jgi:hypothetical protein
MDLQDDIKKDILLKLKGLSETVTDSIGEISKGKSAFCSKEIVSKRMMTCKSCPEFIASTSQCKRCGCFMSAKTRLKHATCPIGKWTKDL